MKYPRAVRYMFCVVSVVIATLIRVLLGRQVSEHVEFITYFMAVVYSAWISGFDGGVLTTVLSIVAAEIFVHPRNPPFSFHDPQDVSAMVLFFAEGVAIAALGEAQIIARLTAESSAAKASASAADAQRSLASVAASEARKSAVIHDALDCIIVINGAGIVTEFNPAAETTFGYSRSEAVGRPVADLVIPPSLRDAHRDGLAKYQATGEGPVLGRRIELPAMRAGGDEFPVELAIVPTGTPESGEFTAYIRDLSESKRAQQQIQQAGARQWSFVRDVLYSVTQGRLILCAGVGDLPRLFEPQTPPLALTIETGTAELRAAAEVSGLRIGLSAERVFDLTTAVSEAAMNAIVHVGAGAATVYASDAAGVVQIAIVDHGTGIALENLPHATLQKGYTTAGTFGHGMKLMLETADRVYLLTGADGTTVVIEQDRIPAITPADLGDR